MANESTTANLSSSNPTLKSALLIHEIREKAIMMPFIDVVDLTGIPGLAYDFQDLTVTPTASAITTGANEADAITNTQLTSTSRTATAASKGVGALISKIQMEASTHNWEVEAPGILGRALADLMDVDACTVLGGFSGTVGTSGVDATILDLLGALIALRSSAKSMAENCVGVLHTQQLGDMLTDMASGSGNGLASLWSRPDVTSLPTGMSGQGLMSSYAGLFMGKPIFTSANVQTANGGADRAGALFVVKEAIGGVVKWMPQVNAYDGGVNRQLAMQFLGSTAYGFIEKKDGYGISIITDA